MSRYVDIDRLEPKQFENSEVELGVLAYDYEVVQSEPYIDIVRCKECRFSVNVITSWSANGENKRVERLCKVNSHNVNADDFCSYGEREGE